MLLEAVALGAYEDQTLVGFGLRTAAPSPPARTWTVRRGGAQRRRGLQGFSLKTAIQHGVSSKELLAHDPNPGNAAGPIQCVVEGTGIAQREHEVSEEANFSVPDSTCRLLAGQFVACSLTCLWSAVFCWQLAILQEQRASVVLLLRPMAG